VRLLNRYYTSYDLLLVWGDFLLVLAASLLTRQVLAWAGTSSDDALSMAVVHGLAMASIVVISFYYSDLYALDQTLSLHELSHRFAAGLGTACIVIGVISYPIPNFGKSIYVSEMLAMGISLALWRFGFMGVIKQASIRAKVLIVGTRAIGKMVAEELYLKRKLGMEVVGFVSESAGQIALSTAIPKGLKFPFSRPPRSAD
jgi:FlaA1/EpsC-like NDP-sugar epimerase